MTSQATAVEPPYKFDANSINYVQHFIRLLSFGQFLCGQTCNVADRLCQEVTLITQGHVQLLLCCERPREAPKLFSLTQSVTFPVQFRDVTYGTLYVTSEPGQYTLPALPLQMAHLLAQICGWLLYTFEVSALIQGQMQLPNVQMQSSLTKRQHEVLRLMCNGYRQKEIARLLNMTPTTVGKHKQNIYGRLGVHSEREAFLVAYRRGLISPIEGVSHITDDTRP